jgi:spore maturation protein CgeB
VVRVYEPEDSWSYQHMVADAGTTFLSGFKSAYPMLESRRYRDLQVGRALKKADLVIVHEWNAPEIIAEIGSFRKQRPIFRLLFHDTHHRAVTSANFQSRIDLSGYDAVLAYGASLRDLYLENEWHRNAWSWHEAADTRVFRPLTSLKKLYDVVWIGNWGDDERTEELEEFLIQPIRELCLNAVVYGVRYPPSARRALAEAGIKYGGWLPNFRVPEIFARASVTVHVPRRPYVERLPGIPTIRPFEALACGIPLVSAPWRDVEELFRKDEDLLFAKNGPDMTAKLAALLDHPDLANDMSRSGRERIEQLHTCAHRVDALFEILDNLPSRLNGRRIRIPEFAEMALSRASASVPAPPAQL